MLINGYTLFIARPIKDMLRTKEKAHGVSHGLSEVGYDIRLKQDVYFYPPDPILYADYVKGNPFRSAPIEHYHEQLKAAFHGLTIVEYENGDHQRTLGRTALASSVEEFDMPDTIWGELRNKSTHARRFIDATIGTDIEPGWKGFLTIEIIFHGNEPVHLPAGSGIAKVVFHQLQNGASYSGKYQNQEDRPVLPVLEYTEKPNG